MVSCHEFLNGMTLLYGQLEGLHREFRNKAPGTPLMSPVGAPGPSPLLSPRLAFDGPPPVAISPPDEMRSIEI